jgi:hypothetical protein
VDITGAYWDLKTNASLLPFAEKLAVAANTGKSGSFPFYLASAVSLQPLHETMYVDSRN